jgi:hypothetical protein
MYPLELKLFPNDEDWATGDEYLDKKLNSLLINCFKNLNLNSIETFYEEAKIIKPRVVSPSFYLVIELCTKALIGIFDSELEVDQELMKIKGKKNDFEVCTKKITLELKELQLNNHQRLFSSLDIFMRSQDGFEQNPFASFKLKKAPRFYEVKIIYKDLIEKLTHPMNHKFDHELFALLSQKKVVEIEGIGRVWFHQGKIFCVNN